MAPPSGKRKHATALGGDSGKSKDAPQKRAKVQDARQIAVQTTDEAFQHGELDVDRFVRAREWEIKALEAGMRGSKKTLATRAHQSLPRALRRRTASHNVKRIPKRLRARARKEMVEDNTPTVNARTRKPRTSRARLRLETAKQLRALASRVKANKSASKAVRSEKTGDDKHILTRKAKAKAKNNTAAPGTLSAPPKATGKFRKRQREKTWLPTHVFHSKRAHMTPPKEPLWRFAIPLTPTEKCYRPTHRVAWSRGAIAWDTSYMSTIMLEGCMESLCGVLKAMGVGNGPSGQSYWESHGQKWREGTRAWQGWFYEKNKVPMNPIAPVTIIWCALEENGKDAKTADTGSHTDKNKKEPRRKLLIRVHPSAFLQLWNELLAISKLQYPPVMVEDLRFEIGSIEITGTDATEALLGVLEPVTTEVSNAEGNDSPGQTWTALRGLTTVASLPLHALLGFSVSDPRLRYPPRRVVLSKGSETDDRLMKILSQWPPDHSQQAPAIFQRDARLAAARQLASQKAINRRRALAPSGSYPEPRALDPRIPILLVSSRAGSTSPGTWTVLLPWRCVLPVWYSLMHYPLSSGGNVRFGGLNEKRQVAFETGVPWFPADHPGTKAGWEWEVKEREKRKHEWEKRPRGKRIEWTSVDLGRGRKGEIGVAWACDWERLVLHLPDEERAGEGNHDQMELDAALEAVGPARDTTSNNSPLPPKSIRHLVSHLTEQVVRRSATNIPSNLQPALQTNTLISIKITLLTRGTPTQCARLYRLPTTDPELRKQWVDLRQQTLRPKRQSKRKQLSRLPPRMNMTGQTTVEERRRTLASSLLAPAIPSSRIALDGSVIVQAGDATYPVVPDEEDLIGFVTSGSFSLSEGKGIGIGCVLLRKVARGGKGKSANAGTDAERMLCIVREVGQGLGRLAQWEVV